MSPEEYLAKISKDVFRVSRNDVMRGVSEKRIAHYAKKMREGVKFPILWIEFFEDDFAQQEGRHRALAAKAAGIDSVPVLVIRHIEPTEALEQAITMLLQ